MKSKKQYEKFENLSRAILGVSHSEIKSKLDEEKQAKKQAKKLKKSKTSSASREESDRA